MMKMMMLKKMEAREGQATGEDGAAGGAGVDTPALTAGCVLMRATATAASCPDSAIVRLACVPCVWLV